MTKSNIIWLASYPRSGNTLLRTILWQCFGLPSGSIYPEDLKGNQELADYVGHIERGPNNETSFPAGSYPMMKTHEHAKDDNHAIYVVRDGRDAIVSLWKFYRGELSIDELIGGDPRFGTWSDHVRSWNPWERPGTLLLRYEDMTSDLPGILSKISKTLGREILKESLPDRESIAAVDGRYVRAGGDWTPKLSSSQLARFIDLNGEMLVRAGYSI